MDVIGIGLSNIDLVAHVKDDFLKAHGVIKGGAKKLDDLAFARLRADLPTYDAIPGGCAANTVCGLAALGVPTAFYGKIGEDSFESLYRASFAEYKVAYNIAAGAQESSQCAVLVTPDGQRSFAYTHGASWDLAAKDFDRSELENAALICTEVYMFEFGRNSEVARLVFETVQDKKVPFVMKVMDTDFARRYGQKIRTLADSGILTILVGNHENLPSLTGTTGLEDTVNALKDWPCPVLLTANKAGAYYIDKGMVLHHPIEPVENPKNTTGAGDQYLAGFLAGWLDQKAPEECMEFAAQYARQILMHDTARPPLATRHAIKF
ncbi:MAG: hypothetical protein DI626_04290 [Micavibrio aeruginosavorus]|uniref:Carbohydrate kinase PfkB domain-containing protein n=1 Tax=Micavibrio aeruginosavorus TaxID=349221 RepID=A0A2W5BW37_9BACT|nr:MAG: hypothetical protein DI626_04290 [Micavibrio aeruginosavorus]